MPAPKHLGHSRRALLPAFVLAAVLLLLLPAAAVAITQTAAASDAESYVIKSDGTLWAWGGNAFGGLGTGDFAPQGIPLQVGTGTTWESIEHGGSLGMLALKQDGTLWHWGDYSIPATPAPTQYAGAPAWAGHWDTAAAGDRHALLLKNGGELWAFGGNEWGMLGDGTSGPSAGAAAPVRIGSATWQAVAAGYGHNLAVQADGSLWAWGLNDYGQLGQGDNANRPVPTRVGTAADWKAVFCAPHASYAITTGGKLYAWGYNDFGQLGLGSSGGTHRTPAAVAGTGWARVGAGPLDCVAVKTDGSLWAWGYNADGQLGLPADFVHHETPTRVGSATSWVDVACGAYHTVAVTSDDEFAACGANQHGQIGLGFPLYRNSPEQIGTVGGWAMVDASISHAGGIRDDGTLWMWGSNGWGALGFAGAANAPTRVGTEADWKTVSCGAYTDGNFTAAVKTNGTLWAWGDNGTGQLGLGNKVDRDIPTQVGLETDWVTVAASDGVGDRGRQLLGDPYTLDDHTLALKADGTLRAWGGNDYGQLGLGDTSDRLIPTQVGTGTDWQAIASGDDYSAALKADGTLWVWGHNQFGQLGLGGTASVKAPAQVHTGSGADTFAAIACGSGRDSSHMLAVKRDGTLWGWGLSYAGELGQGLSGFKMYDTPIQIAPGSDWAHVACGSSFGDNYSLATKTSGELWAWGGNYRGQLGSSDYVSLYVPKWVTGLSTWQSIVSGSNSFALKQDGTLWAWGDNAWGQLGLGDPTTYPSTSVFPLESFTDTTAPAVSGSAATVATVSSAGSARCSGGWSRVPRTIKVKASDAGAGLSRTQISVTGGVGYVTRSSVTVKNGDVRVLCRAIDRAGNRSAAKYIGHFRIDTTRPKPSAARVTVKRGKTAVLRYRISDYSPCTVKIVIKDSRGRAVKTFSIKGARPAAALTKSFRCALRKGTYRWYVYATDSVGFRQVKAGTNVLSVK